MRNASGFEPDLPRRPTRRTLWPACGAHPRTRPETSGGPWPPRSQDQDRTNRSINGARYIGFGGPPKKLVRDAIQDSYMHRVPVFLKTKKEATENPAPPPPLRGYDPKGRCRFSKSIKITLMGAHHAGDALRWRGLGSPWPGRASGAGWRGLFRGGPAYARHDLPPPWRRGPDTPSLLFFKREVGADPAGDPAFAMPHAVPEDD